MTSRTEIAGPTCTDYRSEMRLLSLNRRLNDTAISEDERQRIREHIERLESELGLD